MGTFSYKALDAKGKLVKGVVEGDSERQVRGQLRAKQLKPVEVKASGEKVETRSNVSRIFQPRISASDLALITRQLSTLVQSNMPLDEALTATAQQARKPRIKTLMLQVRSRVMEGHSLAYALGDFPQVFNDMYRSMVAAGEHSGFLGSVLERLADYTESRQYTQQKFKMAMIYPLILVVVAVAVISLLMVFVVPELVSLFVHSGQQLPALTHALIVSSDFLKDYGFLLLLGFFVLGFLVRRLLKHPGRRRLWHKLQLRIPVFGRFVTAVESARFASTLSILVSSGVPLLEGLRIAGQVLSNRRLREASEKVALAVQEGSSLHRALERENIFPPMMVHMVASGEASGELEAMLSRSAQNQERELDMALGGMMAVLEPLMVVVMAAIVGVIVVAILLPIIEMNNLVA